MDQGDQAVDESCRECTRSPTIIKDAIPFPWLHTDICSPCTPSPFQFLTSSDELSVLVQAIIYVKNNEPSIGRVTLVHCYDKVDEIPPELESNHQLVDEAFPTITVDLCFSE